MISSNIKIEVKIMTTKRKQKPRVTFDLPMDIRTRFKIKCLENGSNMTLTLKKWVYDYVGEEYPDEE